MKPKNLKYLVICMENRDYTFCFAHGRRGGSCFIRQYAPALCGYPTITIHRDGPFFRLDQGHLSWPSWAPRDKEAIKAKIEKAKSWKNVHRILDDAMEYEAVKAR